MKGVPAKSCPSCAEQYDADVLFCPRDGTPLASTRNPSLHGMERDPYLGVELPGQIRLTHLIGIGSMGRVYRAFQGGIERDVAVKVLHRELSGNAELVGRFHREAKVASRLVHPNVVQVLMTGALPKGDDPGTGGELYLVMEHLDGISLLSALAAAGTSGEGQALPLPRALHVALQICDAVGEAHAQGIVHRDLKPENVMLVRRGDDPDYVKVLDFGIARLDWADRAHATQAGLIFGTAKYISPEGAEGQAVGPAADVYSIATMLFQMLAGRTPFEGDSPVALLVQHTHAPPPPLRTIARASYVPEPLEATIMANLAKKPAERAPNARALGRDLIAAARAGGLFPEEIATQSTLLSPASMGAVKLASKERTRSHELSAGLAAKIGGVAATPAPDPVITTAPPVVMPDASTTPPPSATPPPAAPTPLNATVPGEPLLDAASATPQPIPPPAASQPSLAAPVSNPGLLAPPSSPGFTPPPSGRGRPGDTHIDLDATGHDDVSIGPNSTMPGLPLSVTAPPATPAPPGSLVTIQGTEQTVEAAPVSKPKRARVARLAAIVACVLAVVPIAVVGGKRLGGGAAAQDDTVEAALDDARDAMRRRAWDAPPGRNFKEITDLAMRRFPESLAVVELRRAAAGQLVAEALGRKYANDIPDATRLVKLALDFDPGLTTAQHLAAELAPKPPEAQPSSSVGSASSASARPKGQSAVRGRDTRPLPRLPPTPPKDTATPRPPVTGAVLPQPPAPKPPAPSGPWL
jgi:eukaryotic-like serine/threonine-protein kinase